MDPIATLAASGLRARMDTLDLLANNIANGSTTGFKADWPIYGADSGGQGDGSIQQPVLWSRWIDHQQGALRQTGDPLNIALEGAGFLVAQGKDGPVLTRGGDLVLSKDGTIGTPDGLPLLNTENQPIRVDPRQPFTITQEGSVSQQGRDLGRLKVVQSTPTGELTRREGVHFDLSSAPANPLTSPPKIRQGSLETSNVNPADSAAKLISVLRQSESLQRAVQLGGEMNRRAAEEVGRVHT